MKHQNHEAISSESKKQKIGILSFHHSKSFGAVLQCYALCKVLKEFGHEAELIDYKPWNILRRKIGLHKTTIIRPSEFIENIFYIRPKFRNFINRHIPKSRITYWSSKSLKRNCPKYDIYISGSDQVWNSKIFHVFDTSYFLDFVPNGQGRLVSYAASFGEDQPEENKDILTKLINRFSNISVREKHGQNLVKALTGKSSEVVMDPVFLLKDYNEIIVNSFTSKPYILVYCLEKTDEFLNIVMKMKENSKLEVICVGTIDIGIGTSVKYIGPEEWLEYLKKATYVCTNSFHGVAFSIIFKKSFFVFPISQRFVRIENLLIALGLQSRIIKNSSEIKKTNLKIDTTKYSDAIFQLKVYVKKSLEFLRNINP